MSKSRKFNRDQSSKLNRNKSHRPKSGWEPKRDRSDRDINRRAQLGDWNDDDDFNNTDY